jgi:carbonic anhydrase
MSMVPAPWICGLSVLLNGSALAVGAQSAAAEEATPHWSYSGETGPTHWASEDVAFATCGSGKHQSPIDIEKTVAEALPALEFAYQPIALTVTDTGHSFQVNAPPGSGGFTVGGEHYDLVQFHFHRPSEEEIHGHRYAMVAHLVHKSAKGELAVVAVLIHSGEANAFLEQVFDHFPPKGTTETKVADATLNLGEFLPRQRGYYTFDGSLTTPPCTEHVRWFVLKSPVQASSAQVQQFAARYPRNARTVQPLNGRAVAATRD